MGFQFIGEARFGGRGGTGGEKLHALKGETWTFEISRAMQSDFHVLHFKQAIDTFTSTEKFMFFVVYVLPTLSP